MRSFLTSRFSVLGVHVSLLVTGTTLFAGAALTGASTGGVLAVWSVVAVLMVDLGDMFASSEDIADGVPKLRQALEVFDFDLERSGGVVPERAAGAVSFDRVTFAYPRSAPVLRDISFAIPAGQRVVMLGSSADGKTTLADLLLGFMDPSSGTVALDGHPTTELDLDMAPLGGRVHAAVPAARRR